MSKVVIGFGNPLLSDEGVGINVIQQLEELELPNTDIIDGGTQGWVLFNLVEQYDKIIIIDAIKSGNQTGNLYTMRASEIFENSSKKYDLTIHDFNLLNIFSIMARVYTPDVLEKIVVIGVEVNDMNLNLKLSPEIKEKVPEIVDIVLDNLKFE